jgi:hypothetical protein
MGFLQNLYLGFIRLFTPIRIWIPFVGTLLLVLDQSDITWISGQPEKYTRPVSAANSSRLTSFILYLSDNFGGDIFRRGDLWHSTLVQYLNPDENPTKYMSSSLHAALPTSDSVKPLVQVLRANDTSQLRIQVGSYLISSVFGSYGIHLSEQDVVSILSYIASGDRSALDDICLTLATSIDNKVPYNELFFASKLLAGTVTTLVINSWNSDANATDSTDVLNILNDNSVVPVTVRVATQSDDLNGRLWFNMSAETTILPILKSPLSTQGYSSHNFFMDTGSDYRPCRFKTWFFTLLQKVREARP